MFARSLVSNTLGGVVIVGSFGAASPTLAQHGGDILLDVSAGRIRTNLIDGNSQVTVGKRVFAAEFGEVDPNFTDEPGFDSDPGAFSTTSGIGFRIRKALRVWDGARFRVVPGPQPEWIEIAFSTLGPVATPACDAVTSGFTLSVAPNGEWHRHLEFTLTQPARTGIYLLELELFSTDAGLSPSRPFWVVFSQLHEGDQTTDPAMLEIDHEEAQDWVEANLVPRLCDADFNASGQVTVQDLFDYLQAWFARDGAADVNGSCTVTVQDLFDYLGLWFARCP